MKKLRLILTRKCNRNCKGCCNNQNLFLESNIPIFDNKFEKYDQIILTGGEPSLIPITTILTGVKAKFVNPNIKVIVYTAESNLEWIEKILKYVDGVTITLHEQSDVDNFNRLNFWLLRRKTWIKDNNKTLRLNIFKGIDIYMQNDSLWKIKNNIEWIENCPLPENEIIMQI